MPHVTNSFSFLSVPDEYDDYEYEEDYDYEY